MLVLAKNWLTAVVKDAQLLDDPTLALDDGISSKEAWSALCRRCHIEPDDLARLVAQHFELELADLDTAEERALRLVPERVARQYGVLPLSEDDRHITVATSDPTDLAMEEALRFASGRQPTFAIAAPGAILEAIDARYSPARAVESLLDRVGAEVAEAVRLVGEGEPEKLAASDIQAPPVVKLTNLILRDAIRERASDIHVEPGPKGGVVRFRVDGVLRPYMKLPMQALNRVVSRIKVMGEIDIADRLRPQDGRARVEVEREVYDLRISTLPTRDSEKAVIRVLAPRSVRGLEDIQLGNSELSRLRHLLGHRSGIVIVTGPTGSGKTTTLYAGLQELALGELNVVSVEDPVEYDLEGVTQIQVEPRQGVTFASALRAILRQDPDVILVGEIRDLETAESAVQAAMTGHLVLATLHTNDAVGAIPRLLDLGLDRSVVGATLRGVLAQRLIRRICSYCAVPAPDTPSVALEHLTQIYGVRQTVQAVGCARCGQTGYRGRVPAAEVLIADARLEEHIVNGSSVAELERAAIRSGMRTMLDAALERVTTSETTLEEVERVLGEVEDAPPPRSVRPHVLVVDDDPVLRLVVRSLLEGQGFDVTEASDGLAALKRINEVPDMALMVLDLEMPRFGGEEVIRRLRSSIATAGLPIVVLTGSGGEETEARLIGLGADDYIRKPLDPGRFLARIKAALRRAGA